MFSVLFPEFRILEFSRLNFEADYDSSIDLFSIYLLSFWRFNLKLIIFVGILQVLIFEFQKFRIFEILFIYLFIYTIFIEGDTIS